MLKRQKLIAAIALPSILALAGMTMIGLQLRQERMNDDLVEAVQKNNVKGVKRLLNSGADANRRVSESHRRSFRALLQAALKGKLNQSNANSSCLLAVAVQKNSTPIVEELLDHHATGVNEKAGYIPWDGAEPVKIPILLIAAFKKNPKIIFALLDHKADLQVKDDSGNGLALCATAFFPEDYQLPYRSREFQKSSSVAFELMKEFIRRGVNPLQFNDINESLIKKAADSDQSDLVDYLLTFRQKRESLDNCLGSAIRNDNLRMAHELVRFGGNASEPNPNLDGAIFDARSLPMMLYILKHGARLETRQKKGKYAGYTLLHFAARDGDRKRIEFLIRRGYNVNDTARNCETPLMLAAQYADVSTLESLIRHGAKVNFTTKDCISPLFCASMEGMDENIGCLLEHGADPNVRSSDDGTTALMYAVEDGNDEAVRNLLAGGAKVNLLDKQGHRALDYADGNAPVIKLLRKYGAKAGHGPPMDL